MKNLKYIVLAILCGFVYSCSDLDLSPNDAASTGKWFQTPEQFEMNLNAILLHEFWPMERNEWTSGEQIELDGLTDDYTNRSSVSRYMKDQVDGTFVLAIEMWNKTYTGINRCNKIIHELKKLKGSMDEERYQLIEANARFYRACFYGRLLIHFGDVVVVDEDLDTESEEGRESAYKLTRTNCMIVLDQVLHEFDEVAKVLPTAYPASEVQRATKGAAYGMKARYALHFASILKWDKPSDGYAGLQDPEKSDSLFEVARDAAKNCMDLGVYTLHSDFGSLFHMATRTSPEHIFAIPRSKALCNNSKYQYLYSGATRAKLSRLSNAPTCTTCCPSWDLLCSFVCTDGLPIDESPLYDPHEPFKNRDPRLAQTIVEFGTQHLGVIYEPRFDVDKVFSAREGKMVTNNDSRTYLIAGNSNQYASYNGLVLKKHVDDDWLSPFEAENTKIILRYADILLMYAEAKIELNQIDQSTVDAINEVRARAYGVSSTDVTNYPAVTIMDQSKMRTIIRTERRMEFAFENLRLYDIWRWRIAEKVLNYPNMGLPKKSATLQKAYMSKNMWFNGAVPAIDENGSADFLGPVAKGVSNFFTSYAVKLSSRKFVAPKSYLWPVPTPTLQVMTNIKENNVGY